MAADYENVFLFKITSGIQPPLKKTTLSALMQNRRDYNNIKRPLVSYQAKETSEHWFVFSNKFPKI